MITPEHQDALTEVLNIGFGRTAAALSGLTGYRVLLDPPSVQVYAIDELPNGLGSMATGELASVHQIFSGPVAGDAVLLLQEQDGAVLARLLAAGDEKPTALSPSDKEVLTEVGNILLSACLAIFGDMLQVHMSFGVPRLRLESLTKLLSSLKVGAEELSYGLIITARFFVRETSISGRLVIILGVTSLDRLLQAVGAFERNSR